MKLFKNVDLCDLESILTKGILSLDECDNDNWDSGKRADNATNVVYLFNPTGKQNSFPYYGIVLVEVEAEAEKSDISEHDAYYGRYEEYVCTKIDPEQIKMVYIPEIFKNKVPISHSKIRYVKLEATHYDEDTDIPERIPCTDIILKRFAETAPIADSTEFNFFRGVTEKRHMIVLYDVRYII